MGNKASLTSGESLEKDKSLSLGKFDLFFQKDLNLVLYHSRLAIWSSNSGIQVDNSYDVKLVMNVNGNLEIGDFWSSNTSGNPGAFLKLEDFGVATIYAKNGQTVLWTTSVLPSSTHLLARENRIIMSRNKEYELKFQSDGNLVLYHRSSRAVMWQTHTAGNSDAVLQMQGDGNLVVYSHDSKAKWAVDLYDNGSRLTVEDSGYISIGHRDRLLWTNLSENWMSILPNSTKVRFISYSHTKQHSFLHCLKLIISFIFDISL